MNASAPVVRVEVAGGPSVDIEWTPGITALKALEAAQVIIEPDPNEQFTFALQFYSGLGYLVIMINETYDSFISRGGEKATPFFYWEFLINGLPAGQSVDNSTMSPGDVIRFEFEMFTAKHEQTLVSVKHRRQVHRR